MLNPDNVSLFLNPVRDFRARSPVTTGPKTTARDVARQMVAAGVGSVVIVGDDDVPLGIVTDRDLRSKVVAQGRDPVHVGDLVEMALAIRPDQCTLVPVVPGEVTSQAGWRPGDHAGLPEAIGRIKARQWAEENADVIRSTNEYIEKHGLPLAKYRMF